jgi:cell wall-associated NlpC family hydrolase
LTKTALDPRRHPYRSDLAAEALRGKVAAARYVKGEVRRVIHPATPLWVRPDAREGWATQALFGECLTVYEEKGGWAWVQLERDGYVGYVGASALAPQVWPPTHRVRAPGTFVYAAADAKAHPGPHLSMTSLLSVAETGAAFSRLAEGGFVPTRHIAVLGRFAPDFVAVAERFVGTPYVWGGKTRLGLDCSGLVQVAMHAAGLDCPRDSDMQMAELGRGIDIRADLDGLQRGDLVFWRGHVGIMTDAFMLLHANAHHMAVVAEPLRGAVDRIARSGPQIMAIRRLDRKGAKDAREGGEGRCASTSR